MDPDSPLFQLSDGTILTKNDQKQWMDRLILKMGLDWGSFYLYSYRIGGATSYARRNIDHRIIQSIGRWRSDAYQIYIKLDNESAARNQSSYIKTPVHNPNLVFLDNEAIPSNQIMHA